MSRPGRRAHGGRRMANEANEAVVRGYLRAVEAGDAEVAAAFLAEGMVLSELPNRLKPMGDTRPRERVLADLAKAGDTVTPDARTILGVTSDGDRVVVEATWTGTLTAPVGETRPGGEVACHSATVFTLAEGLIIEQRSYDCFEEP